MAGYVEHAIWHEEWTEGEADEPPASCPATVPCLWGDNAPESGLLGRMAENGELDGDDSEGGDE